MNIVERAKNILLSPRTEWVRIAAEPATPGGLFTGYAVILAVLPAIGSILGSLLIGQMLGMPGVAIGPGFMIASAVLGYALGLGLTYLIGIIAASLAPSFDGRNVLINGLKLVVYASTPVWVIGILNFIPGFSIIFSLIGLGYAIYLIYLGATPVMAVPQSKAGGYAAVVVIIWFVLSLIMGAIIGAIAFSLFLGAAATSPYGL